MRKNKTIKKPKFIKLFLLRLAIMWVITGMLGGYLYLLTDAKCNRIMSRGNNASIETMEELCDQYYEAYYKYKNYSGPDELQQNYWEMMRARKKLQFCMDMTAADSGLYAELHVDDEIVATTDFTNGVSAHYIWNAGMFTDGKLIMSPAIPLDELVFDCNGEKMTFSADDRIDDKEFLKECQMMRVGEVNTDLGAPFWNFTSGEDEYDGNVVRMIHVTECYVDSDQVIFIPNRFTINDVDENGETIKKEYVLEYENKSSLDNDYFFSSDDLLSDNTNVGTSIMLVNYAPKNMLGPDDVTSITDGEHYLHYNNRNEITMLFSSGDTIEAQESTDITFGDWTLWIAEPEYVSLFESAPEMVIKNFILWLAMASVIALIISLIRYYKRKSMYEIVEYRRKVTDSMAHDLKTPLAAISAYAENLEENINSDKRAYYSSKIRENTGIMNQMIEGILDFSKSETGKVKAKIKEVSMKGLIDSELASVIELFKKNNINVDIKGNDVLVKTDESIMRQALRNLIGNASKFTRKGGKLDITIEPAGITMTNPTDEKIKDIKHIKDPFVKGTSERGSMEGTGLGLAIAESSLEACGHKLEISMEGDMFKAVIKF